MTKEEAWFAFAGTTNYGTIQRTAFGAGWDAARKTDQEPVAWMHLDEGLSYQNRWKGSVPLYLHPSRHLILEKK